MFHFKDLLIGYIVKVLKIFQFLKISILKVDYEKISTEQRCLSEIEPRSPVWEASALPLYYHKFASKSEYL